jgi:hypothetical protein
VIDNAFVTRDASTFRAVVAVASAVAPVPVPMTTLSIPTREDCSVRVLVAVADVNRSSSTPAPIS